MSRASASAGRFDRRIALLAGLALLAGMTAVVSPPARAADPEPSYPAVFDACPEDIIPGSDFADVPTRHDNANDINCIAYYGITKGKTATTYAPDDPVIREHMALFLVRMAELVGIDLPSPSSTPFTDTAQLSQESQDAISQIYQLEITIGASPTTYAPGRNVSRGEMALFLQRLMDQMDTVTDGRDTYGYVPDDVDDNDDDHEIKVPYLDLDNVSHSLNDAVTELYELGVGTGLNGSSQTYGPNEEMSRAAMAEFMAAILDHSNLRPAGIHAHLSPTRGAGDFDITAMISVRDDEFQPIEDRRVDWFFSADSGGGLQQDGTCDAPKIQVNGDCRWDDQDESTDRDGNLFQKFEVLAGETITFYAWIGNRDGQSFDRDTAEHSVATAQSIEDPANVLVRHDIPEHAAVMRGDIHLMDRRSSVEFIIQLLDDEGRNLERAGVEVIVEIESREISVDADDVTRGRPDPDYTSVGRDTSRETVHTTNRRGEVVFELDGPSADERLDAVTVETDCCADQEIRIAWSDSQPVLVSAKPSFTLYQERSNNGTEIEFEIEYLMYDQYGIELRGHRERYTGRDDDVEVAVSALLYEGALGNGVFRFTPGDRISLKESVIRGLIRADVEETGLDTDREYFLLVEPDISTGSGNSKITYAEPVIVWIVKEARSQGDLADVRGAELGNTGTPSVPSGVDFEEVDLYPEDDKFRTFFTVWSYDSETRFQVKGEDAGVTSFERSWAQRVDDADDLEIPIYGPVDFIRIK